jgi:hypothetical protein
MIFILPTVNTITHGIMAIYPTINGESIKPGNIIEKQDGSDSILQSLSSVGRASALHAECRGFESLRDYKIRSGRFGYFARLMPGSGVRIPHLAP